jgi:PAS domain-containing protein
MNIEGIVTRVTLQLVVAYSFAAAIAAWLLMPHRGDDPVAYWIVIPTAVMVSTGIAYLLARRGRARLGAAIALVACYAALVGYVVFTGLGLRSYALTLGCVLIAASSTLVGHRAGIAATVIGIASVIALFLLEKAGLVTDLSVVQAIPPINIMVVYGIAFAAVGTLSLAFSRAFGTALQTTRDQEARFRHLLEAAPLGYLLHRDGRILLANQRAARGTRHPSAEAMVGLDIKPSSPAADPQATRSRLAQAYGLVPGRRSPAEYEIPDLRGGMRRVAAHHADQMVDGPALTVIRDVTQERAAADALAHAKRAAEEANRAAIFATMSHGSARR